jgi:hypothetical protein
MLQRLFPKQIDNRFEGHRLALWLLGIHVGLRMVIGINSIANTAKVAAGADGYRLADYGADGARAVLMLFSLSGLAGLTMALLGVIVLLRYRAMAPLLLLLLLFDFLARRMIIQNWSIERSGAMGFAWWLNSALLAMLVLGLALSFWPRRDKPQAAGQKP